MTRQQSTVLSRRGFLRTATAGTTGLAGGFALRGVVTNADDEVADATDVDIGFCNDMSLHHVQALAMCQRVLGRDTGDAVQAAAAEVLQTQAIEVGMMRAWLVDWGQSTTAPSTVMAWMGMNGGAGMPAAMMSGLATDDEMRALSQREGMAQGKLWIELMRAHHVGGVAMAEAAIELASAEKVQRLARIQATVQAFEIGQYDLLLATDYA